jgi:hypothetical protein
MEKKRKPFLGLFSRGLTIFGIVMGILWFFYNHTEHQPKTQEKKDILISRTLSIPKANFKIAYSEQETKGLGVLLTSYPSDDIFILVDRQTQGISKAMHEVRLGEESSAGVAYMGMEAKNFGSKFFKEYSDSPYKIQVWIRGDKGSLIRLCTLYLSASREFSFLGEINEKYR